MKKASWHDKLRIIPIENWDNFLELIDFDVTFYLSKKALKEIPVDYFEFYNSVSSVYSSKIEGEDIDFDSFFKHKFLKVKFKPDYTKKADDLFSAYEFILEHQLSKRNVFRVHKILSKNLLPDGERGNIRNNPMYVINEADRIEYVAASPTIVADELSKLFDDISILLKSELNIKEVFFFAAMIHLIFVKIHPFQDGNGRTARLIEKWFLKEKLGNDAFSIELEKNYYLHHNQYYHHIRKLGLEYENLDYCMSLDFLLMTVNSLK